MKKIYLVLTLLIGIQLTSAQEKNETQIQMSKLDFMVGDWIGTTKAFSNQELTSEHPAYQAIHYNLDAHIIEINLKSPTLQLHTVIGYSVTDSMYFYSPFSKNGSRTLPAFLEDGKFVVHANDTTQFIFQKTATGFMEWGRKQINGTWQIYFQDEFTRVQ